MMRRSTSTSMNGRLRSRPSPYPMIRCRMQDAGSLLSKTASREADSDLTGGGIAAVGAVAATSDSIQSDWDI